MAAEDKTDKQEQKAAKSIRVWVGVAAIVCFICIALGFKLFGSHNEPVAADEPTVGVVDLQQAFRAHRLYGRLSELENQARVLAADLETRAPKLDPKAPKTESKLFDDAAMQKYNLEAITKKSKKMEEFQARAEEIRDQLRPQFQSEMDALDKEYANRILNLKLKADNADAMGLSPESKQSLINEYMKLHDERETRREKLSAEQQERLNNQVEADISGERQKLQDELAVMKAKAKSQELQRQLQIQDKNTKALDKALEPIQQQRLNARKKALLAAKLTEIKLVKQQIYNDIAGRAAKLAVIYHLTLIVSNPVDNLRGMEYDRLGIQPWTELKSPVIGVNTIDLTEELLQEIKSIQE